MNEPTAIRVVLANDLPVVRQGLALILSREPGIALVGVAGSAGEALQFFRNGRADVALIDLSRSGGVDFVSPIQRYCPAARIVVLTVHAAEDAIFRALEAGARAYLTTDVDAEELLHAIRTVHGGGRYLSSLVAQRLAARMAAPRLSSRQLAILQLIALGRENKEIAGQLGLHDGTVKAYIHRIFAPSSTSTAAAKPSSWRCNAA